MSSNCLRASLNQVVMGTGLLPVITISDEDKARIIITNSTGGNTVLVRARIVGQDDWDTIATLTGNSKQVVNVSTYDQIQLECTVFASASSYIKVVLGSFNEAGGSTSIDAPTGGTVSSDTITFTSSDNSVVITSNPGTSTIDFVAVGGGGSTPKYTQSFGLVDWGSPVGNEYILTIPAVTHGKTNPVVTAYESVAGEFERVEISVVLNSNDVKLIVLSSPDTRFVGKVFIE